MKALIEEYGTAILVVLVISLLAIMYSPIGDSIRDGMINQSNKIESSRGDAMAKTYKGGKVISLIIKPQKTVSNTEITDKNFFKVSIKYKNESGDTLTEQITNFEIEKTLENDNEMVYEIETTVDNGMRLVNEVTISKASHVYVGYKSKTKELIFGNKLGDLAACDKKYGDIGVDMVSWNSPTAQPWYTNISNIEKVTFKSKIKPTSTAYLFANLINLKSIKMMVYLDTTNVTNMKYMFYNCMSLPSLDLSNFNTSNVTDMNSMFFYCGYYSMYSLDLGNNFDTSNVTDMSYMFSGCGYKSMVSLDMGENFDTSNVEYMTGMFQQCGYNSLTELDLGDSFHTSSVTNMNSMFSYCGYMSLASLNLGEQFSTDSVTDVSKMFNGCGQNAATNFYLGNFFVKQASDSSLSSVTYTSFMWNMNVNDILHVANSDVSNLIMNITPPTRMHSWTLENNFIVD